MEQQFPHKFLPGGDDLKPSSPVDNPAC